MKEPIRPNNMEKLQIFENRGNKINHLRPQKFSQYENIKTKIMNIDDEVMFDKIKV